MEYQIKKQLTPRFVESCTQLLIGDLCRGLLRSQKDKNAEYSKQGIVKLLSGLHIGYTMNSKNDFPELKIRFVRGKKIYEQIIKLKRVPVTFGQRPYFECPLCKRRVAKLFLRSDFNYWGCQCLNLKYEVQNINRKTQLGEARYVIDRSLKIDRMKQKVKKIAYKQKKTRRAESVMKMSIKWCFSAEVQRRLNAQMAMLLSKQLSHKI
ncbi:MAG: hypothetical protein ABH896_01860 [Candidatus Jacksonbacteria bacterium]